jgi:hypothetical protein
MKEEFPIAVEYSNIMEEVFLIFLFGIGVPEIYVFGIVILTLRLKISRRQCKTLIIFSEMLMCFVDFSKYNKLTRFNYKTHQAA